MELVVWENVIPLIVAIVSSGLLWQLISGWINRRANKRKADAEAGAHEAAAAIAFVGVEKAEVENERSLVAGAGELTQEDADTILSLVQNALLGTGGVIAIAAIVRNYVSMRTELKLKGA